MNKAIVMGRLTKDPEVRYSNQGDNSMAIARYTLAVDRRFKREGENDAADFIPCVAFGKAGEFAQKYFRKGMKVSISGRIQTGSYNNKDGQKVYTTEVVIEEQEFAESKNSGSREERDNASLANAGYTSGGSSADPSGFMNIPDGIEDDLPFN